MFQVSFRPNYFAQFDIGPAREDVFDAKPNQTKPKQNKQTKQNKTNKQTICLSDVASFILSSHHHRIAGSITLRKTTFLSCLQTAATLIKHAVRDRQSKRTNKHEREDKKKADVCVCVFVCVWKGTRNHLIRVVSFPVPTSKNTRLTSKKRRIDTHDFLIRLFS